MRAACMNFISFFPGVIDHIYHPESDCMVIKGEYLTHSAIKKDMEPYTVTIVPDIKKTYDYLDHMKIKDDDPKLEELGHDCRDDYPGYRLICDREGRLDSFTFSSTDELQSLINSLIKCYGGYKLLSGLEIGSNYAEYHDRAEIFFYDIIEGFKEEDGYRVVSVDPVFYTFKVYEQETGLNFDMSVKTRQKPDGAEDSGMNNRYVLTPYIYGCAETGYEFWPGAHALKIIHICSRDEIHQVMVDARKRDF